MKETRRFTGKNMDIAIENALTQLGLERDSVEVDLIAREKPGFLGFGAQPAKVQVTYEVPDPVPAAVPEKPKSALGSASRSKPKKFEPKKAPEAPKAPAPKAEAPKAEPKKAEPRLIDNTIERPARKISMFTNDDDEPAALPAMTVSPKLLIEDWISTLESENRLL